MDFQTKGVAENITKLGEGRGENLLKSCWGRVKLEFFSINRTLGLRITLLGHYIGYSCCVHVHSVQFIL